VFCCSPFRLAYIALSHTSHLPRSCRALGNHRPSIITSPSTGQECWIRSLDMCVALELSVRVSVLSHALTARAIEHAKAAYWLFSASHCAISSWWSGSTCPVRLKCRIALVSVIVIKQSRNNIGVGFVTYFFTAQSISYVAVNGYGRICHCTFPLVLIGS